jgi:cytochrome c oxidase subunit IV
MTIVINSVNSFTADTAYTNFSLHAHSQVSVNRNNKLNTIKPVKLATLVSWPPTSVMKQASYIIHGNYHTIWLPVYQESSPTSYLVLCFKSKFYFHMLTKRKCCVVFVIMTMDWNRNSLAKLISTPNCTQVSVLCTRSFQAFLSLTTALQFLSLASLDNYFTSSSLELSLSHSLSVLYRLEFSSGN